MSEPQISKPSQSPLYDLSDHPKHAALIGEIAATWSLVEYQLGAAFGLALRAPPWHALTAYYAIVNANARNDVMRATVERLTMDDESKADFVALLDDARKVAGKRNKFIHALWLTNKGNPYIVEKLDHPIAVSQKRLVSLPELKQVRSDLHVFAERVSQFVIRLSGLYPLHITHTEVSRTSKRTRL